MIRPMATDDAPDVCELFRMSLGYDCVERVVSHRIEVVSADRGHIALVWADDDTGAVRGFIHACRYDTLHDAGGWDVIALAVAPDAQGHGIGRALLGAFETQAAQGGGRYVRLNSRVERIGAHGFYEHLGYECDKLQKRYYRQLRE